MTPISNAGREKKKLFPKVHRTAEATHHLWECRRAHPGLRPWRALLIGPSVNIQQPGLPGSLPCCFDQLCCMCGDSTQGIPTQQANGKIPSCSQWLLAWLNQRQPWLRVFFTHAWSVITSHLLEGKAKHTRSRTPKRQEQRTSLLSVPQKLLF